MFSIKKCVFYIIIKLHKRIKHMENDINIDFADYQTILSHRGRVDGLVGSCKVEDKMLRFEMVS